MRTSLVFLLSLCLTIAGCTSTRTISLADVSADAVPALKSGDRVRITLSTGEPRRMVVESVSTTTLTGRNLDGSSKGATSQLALADIREIAVQRTSVGKSAGLAVGILVGVAALALGALLLALDCGNDDECEE